MRLLKTIGSVAFTGQERAALNKLTMPVGDLWEAELGWDEKNTTLRQRRKHPRKAAGGQRLTSA